MALWAQEDPRLRLGLWRTLCAMKTEHGMTGLFKGALPRALHSGGSSGATTALAVRLGWSTVAGRL